MSIRLRLTLLYSAILALTLIVFGLALYTVQAQNTLEALKHDMSQSGDGLGRLLLWRYRHPNLPISGQQRPPPAPPDASSAEPPPIQPNRERNSLRVLNPDGSLAGTSLCGEQETALPLGPEGPQNLQRQQGWWVITVQDGERQLVYNNPIVADGKIVSIVQVGRSLAERDRSLLALSRTLIIASLLTTLIAFGIGWALAGAALRPIHRITQTAQAIGNDSDFTRRVNYEGPNDEIGQLAITFNSMLARLQNAYQRVSQALHLQRDFVADVSHELRTPLTTVSGNLALLRRQPPPPIDEQVDILTDLMDESDRLIRLVNNLLVLARADAGRALLSEPVLIPAVVEEACHQAQQLDCQRLIELTLQPVTVKGDRDALKQVLLILLDNAIKHTQGTVRVAVEAAQSDVTICVSDNGVGMSPEVLQHVFDRFYRGDVDPNVHGFGLGLPIAKALVEGQGGTIAVESQVGCGTMVRVHLPQWLPA